MSFLVSILLLVTLPAIVTSQTSGSDPVEIKWGIADGSAVVGRLFQMHIPGDAFSGKVISFKTLTSNGDPLPSWIDFDPVRNVIYGIPTKKDIGQLELEVTAKGESSEVSETFTIVVRDVPSLTSGGPLKFHKTSGPEMIRCKREEPETVATIIIDADMDTSHVKERLALMQKFLGHMNLQHDMVKMVPVGNSPLQDSSALVSGTGDCISPKTPGLFISWPVGCGQVKEGHFPGLQRLDDDSTNGKMAQALGYSVIGWRVSNSHLQAPKRKRRQVMATATPALTPVMPTKTDTGGSMTDEPEDKMTRVVPMKSSPVVIQPTPTQPPTEKTKEPTMPPKKTTEEIKPTEPVKPVVTEPKTTKTLPPITEPPTTTEETETSTSCIPGQQPKVKKPISKLQFNVGDIINFVIPVDTFEDCETGGTRRLTLMLFEDTSTTLAKDFFLQFDDKMQKIIGLPMESDVGVYKMNLVARKEGTPLATVPFKLVIKETKGKKKINHALSVAIDLDYDNFISDVRLQTDLANKVASVYGDSDSRNLVITKIAPGSVLYGWANKTLNANKNCPAEGIGNLVNKLVNPDGTLTDNAIEKMKPYVLLGAEAAPMGACEKDPAFPAIKSKPRFIKTTTAPDVSSTDGKTDEMEKKTTEATGSKGPAGTSNATSAKPGAGGKGGEEEEKKEKTTESVAKGSKGGDDGDVMVTTIVPAIVIVVILVVALIIACVLYRKRRKGQMNVEEQNTFVNKGAPVIFPDELEDKPNDVHKPLLVEGSPAPPPEYHRGVSESPDPEIANNHRNNTQHSAPNDGSISEMPEKPYEPPPPVAATSNNKQPRPTQQPMSQPPQILP